MGLGLGLARGGVEMMGGHERKAMGAVQGSLGVLEESPTEDGGTGLGSQEPGLEGPKVQKPKFQQ